MLHSVQWPLVNPPGAGRQVDWQTTALTRSLTDSSSFARTPPKDAEPSLPLHFLYLISPRRPHFLPLQLLLTCAIVWGRLLLPGRLWRRVLEPGVGREAKWGPHRSSVAWLTCVLDFFIYLLLQEQRIYFSCKRNYEMNPDAFIDKSTILCFRKYCPYLP